jgi:hypothetical protein
MIDGDYLMKKKDKVYISGPIRDIPTIIKQLLPKQISS